MTEEQELFWLLVALFLFECCHWVPRDAIAIRRRIGRGWQAVVPSIPFGNESGYVLVASPLPPFEPPIVCQWWPIAVSPDGLLAETPQAPNPGPRPPQSGRFLRWDEVRSAAAEGRTLLVNGTRFARLATPRLAEQIAQRIERWRGSTAAERDGAIRAARAALDISIARERLDAARRAGSALRIPAIGLWLLFFVVGPVVVWRLGLALSWPYLFGALATLHVTGLLLFSLAHQRLEPAARAERRAAIATMALLPLETIRARDRLLTACIGDLHPLAAFAALAEPARLAEFAAPIVRDLNFPIPGAGLAPDAAATQAWYRDRLIETVAEFLASQRLSPVALPAGPLEADRDEAVAYCPRCLRTFVRIDATCVECGDQPACAWERSGATEPATCASPGRGGSH